MTASPLPQRRLANALRVLAMDAVEKAQSGHPGAPMGMADIAEVLWREFLKHDPTHPDWPDRDRFVLSNGHASMLIYGLLHLSGYDLTRQDLENFRQLHSRTPGHPEYGYTPGVETTTGPLGQGLANAVGMAIAEKTLAAQFNRPGHDIVDHRTHVFVGDGCLMEGISHEVCSLAGTLALAKLTCYYDANGISIDGEIDGWFSDDTAARFRAYGWQVIGPIDGHDRAALIAATQEAHADSEHPSLIICRTLIGAGAPAKQGKEISHGSPLGAAEVAATRAALDWHLPPFEMPADVVAAWDARQQGAARHSAWQERFRAYAEAYPELAAELARRFAGELPADFIARSDDWIASVAATAETVASRKASQQAIESLSSLLPEFLGGSADLAGSNLTLWRGARGLQDAADGNYLHYGVREFGMAAIMNGIALHRGFLPFGGTFLIFMEYARNALRMAAIMQQRVVHVLTHDSIGLGEDGPTHQPVEQLAALRSTPGLHTWRPADALETAVAWRQAALWRGPSALVLSRQNLPAQTRDRQQIADVARGAYILRDSAATPELILMATGSELALVMAAAEELTRQGRQVRVVSMPCMEVFLAQDAAYREAVLPAQVRRRLAVEAAHPQPWFRFVGLDGRVIGMESFGESGPAAALFAHFGFTQAAVLAAAASL